MQIREKYRRDKFYNSKAWRLLADRFKREHPMCKMCEANGVSRIANVVHHIIPRQSYPEYSLIENNLVCLCHKCHKEAHRQLKNGNCIDSVTGKLIKFKEHEKRM